MMFQIDQVFAGYVDQAPIGTFFMPIEDEGAYMLIGEAKDPDENDEAFAVFLSRHDFEFMPTQGNRAWKGLIISDVRIEVDPKSASINRCVGCIYIKNGIISLVAKNRMFSKLINIGVTNSLNDFEVAFTRWSIIHGRGEHRKVLAEIDLGNHEHAISIA
ncbi:MULTISPECIES: hypothetical protein [unclassified Sphingomonas]|uniref:hypothetical protein n=1 Tax=Novosphingobium rhizosphaerae TaxID=1551649 RepID=UPI0015CD3340